MSNQSGLKLDPSWYEANPWIYWADFLFSATFGYLGWYFAILTDSRTLEAALLLFSILALYRAAFFMHEIVHEASRWRVFKWLWNCTIGVPLGVPSLFNRLVHDEHHRIGTFGTVEDPQYRPLSLEGYGTLTRYFGTALWGPLVPVVRYLILFPTSLFFPKFREKVETQFSIATMMRPDYKRRPLERQERRELFVVETLGFIAWSRTLVLLSLGMLPSKMIHQWIIVSIGIVLLHQLRTSVAHLYLRPLDSSPSTIRHQAADAIDLTGGVLAPIVAPLGSRYHATHHLFPEVPYHRLGALHRELQRKPAMHEGQTLTVTTFPNFSAAFASLLGRVRAHRKVSVRRSVVRHGGVDIPAQLVENR